MATLHHTNGRIKWNGLTGMGYHDNGVTAYNKLLGKAYHANRRTAYNNFLATPSMTMAEWLK